MNSPMMVYHEMNKFYSEVSRRCLENTIKECSMIMYSQSVSQSLQLCEIHYSEIPFLAYLRDLWRLGKYFEISQLTQSIYKNDPVLFYFYINSSFKANKEKTETIISFIKSSVNVLNDPFIIYSLAQAYFEQDKYIQVISTIIPVLTIYPFFWDAWILLADSIRTIDCLKNVIEFLISSKSLMVLHAAFLIHKRIRNSTTRQLFNTIEKALKSRYISTNFYLSKIIYKFYILENNASKDSIEIPQYISLEVADLYSDYLYVNSKKEDLKDFAKMCAQTIGWTKESCYVIGNLFSLLQQHEHAMTWFRRAIMIDSNYEAAFIVSGNEYLELKSPNEAIASFLNAIKLNPLNYRSFFSLGSVYFLLDDVDNSIYFLKKAVQLESTDYRLYELLSECYESIGLLEHAINFLNSAIECSGSPHTLLKKAALLYKSLGISKKYIDLYKKFFEFCFSERISEMINDEFDCIAASKICENNETNFNSNILENLSKALIRYKSQCACASAPRLKSSLEGNIAFDYSELQIKTRSVTSSDKNKPSPEAIQEIVNSSFLNFKNCEELIEIINERLSSKRSTILSLLKTLDLLISLLLRGSEKFISIANGKKTYIKNLTKHSNIEVKLKTEMIMRLETDRNYLFECRNRSRVNDINEFEPFNNENSNDIKSKSTDNLSK